MLEKDLEYYQNTIVRELEDKLKASKELYERKKVKFQEKVNEKLSFSQQQALLLQKELNLSKENTENLMSLASDIQEVLGQSLQDDEKLLEELV